MRPRRNFLFEMIPRWIWSMATNEICYSCRRRETLHVMFSITLGYLLINRIPWLL